MRTIILLCCMFFTATYTQAQYRPLSTILLDSVARNGKAFICTDTTIIEPDEIRTDSVGRAAFVYHKSIAMHPAREILLVDTFGFFQPAASGIYNGTHITIINTLPPQEKYRAYNTLWVSIIATGKYESLGIGFFHPHSGGATGYAFSITGKAVRIVKISGGYF